MKFIRVTDSINNREVYINPDNIIAISHRIDKNTNEDRVFVKLSLSSPTEPSTLNISGDEATQFLKRIELLW